jgi:hypothetical protein
MKKLLAFAVFISAILTFFPISNVNAATTFTWTKWTWDAMDDGYFIGCESRRIPTNPWNGQQILPNSNQRYANLQSVNMSCADLSGIDFYGAVVGGVTWNGSNLNGTNWGGTQYNGQFFVCVTAANSNLTSSINWYNKNAGMITSTFAGYGKRAANYSQGNSSACSVPYVDPTLPPTTTIAPTTTTTTTTTIPPTTTTVRPITTTSTTTTILPITTTTTTTTIPPTITIPQTTTTVASTTTTTTVPRTTTTTTTTVAPVVQQQAPAQPAKPQAPATPTLSYTVLNDTTVKISWNSTGKTYQLCPMSSNKLIDGQWRCTSIQITDQTFMLWPLAAGKTESFAIIAVNGSHQFVNKNYIACVDPSCFIFSPWSNWTSVTNNYNILITTTTIPQTTTTVSVPYVAPVAPWKYVQPWKYITKKVLQTVYSNVRTGAICRSGKISTATRNGACSGHGGVIKWLTLPPKKVYVNKKYKCYLNIKTNQYTRNCLTV